MALVNTIYGDMDDSLLSQTGGTFDDQRETTTWTEYRLLTTDELVHRSVHVTLKDPLISTSSIGE